MEEYGKTPKRLVIKSIEHLHAKLLIRLQEDRIKQHEFFVQFISDYINEDPIVMQWVDANPKIKRSLRGQIIRKQEEKKAKRIESDLNLQQKEIDEIFDILEDDLGEL